jgi:nitrite reductase (NADH) large subunit
VGNHHAYRSNKGESLKLVIIGGGIAGHSACRAALAMSGDVEICLINGQSSQLYSPCLLPYHLSGEITRDRLFLPTYHQGEDRERVRLIEGTNAEEIDRERHIISTDKGSHAYDRIILASGLYSETPPLANLSLPGVFTQNDG